MLKRRLTLILKVDNLTTWFTARRAWNEAAPTRAMANNVLMEYAEPAQCAVFGIFGRNTASKPSAGRNAQT